MHARAGGAVRHCRQQAPPKLASSHRMAAAASGHLTKIKPVGPRGVIYSQVNWLCCGMPPLAAQLAAFSAPTSPAACPLPAAARAALHAGRCWGQCFS